MSQVWRRFFANMPEPEAAMFAGRGRNIGPTGDVALNVTVMGKLQ